MVVLLEVTALGAIEGIEVHGGTESEQARKRNESGLDMHGGQWQE